MLKRKSRFLKLLIIGLVLSMMSAPATMGCVKKRKPKPKPEEPPPPDPDPKPGEVTVGGITIVIRVLPDGTIEIRITGLKTVKAGSDKAPGDPEVCVAGFSFGEYTELFEGINSSTLVDSTNGEPLAEFDVESSGEWDAVLTELAEKGEIKTEGWFAGINPDLGLEGDIPAHFNINVTPREGVGPDEILAAVEKGIFVTTAVDPNTGEAHVDHTTVSYAEYIDWLAADACRKFGIKPFDLVPPGDLFN